MIDLMMVSAVSYAWAGSPAGDDAVEELIAGARAGDRAALDTLLRSFQRRVYLLAWRLAGSPTAAEDIAQEVLLKVALHLRKYRQGTNFWAWVARITVNQVHDHHRAAARVAFADPRPAAAAPPERTSDLLHEALVTLSRKDREALVLLEIEGYTSVEAARLLRCLPVTVRTRAAHARRKLREYLSRHFPELGRIP